MAIPVYVTHHLVKGEDLNHHGTLFAGRSAEWFVEAGFIAAAALTCPENIVCLKIHGMSFTRPVRKGEVVRFESRIVLTGRSRMVAHIYMKGAAANDAVVDGFITFVNVDENGHSLPHGITITPETPEETDIQARAAALA
jgi:acyl-CoA hydrolase